MKNFDELSKDEQSKIALAYFKEAGSKQEPTEINEKQSESSGNKQIAMISYESNKKGYVLMYIMSAVFGWSGLHMLHIGFKRTAAFRFMIIPLSLFSFKIGVEDWATALSFIMCMWWISDLITIPFYVNSYNKKLAKKYGVYSDL